MTAEENLATVKMLLGITDGTKDGVLMYLLGDAENLVLGHCRIDILPRQLESIIPAIAADLYRANGYGAEESPSDVKSVSEGQRSVSFDVSRPSHETILKNYYKRIRPFVSRKGRVPSELG